MVFEKYSQYYDALYQNKDYQKEVDFLVDVIKKYSPREVKDVLSLGCGTASHDIELAKRGFAITGVDQSETMLEIAQEKTGKENVNIDFKLGDVTNIKLDKQFDFAMAMFNIAGYMLENEHMEGLLKNTAGMLKKDGLFVFDCWYGPAVLKDKPMDREKQFIQDGKTLTRKTTQKLDFEKNIIDITFEISEDGKTLTTENHKMRFWGLEELESLLNTSGFELVKACNFMDLDSTISDDHWDIFIIAQKI